MSIGNADGAAMAMLTICSEGARKLIEAAELALEMLARRDQLVAAEERDVTSGEQDQVEGHRDV